MELDRSIITDKKVINRPGIVLVDRQNITALIIGTAVPLTRNLPETEKELRNETLHWN